MTYRVGDAGATITFPVRDTNTPPENLTMAPTVRARTADNTTVAIAAADWATPVGPERDLEIPLAALPAGLWALDLIIDDEEDLFLGNVVIQ